MPRLIFVDKLFGGQVFELKAEKISVGRADDNVLAIRHESVSSHHCEILVSGPEIIIRDLNSRNGVYINGSRLKQQAQMKSGQVLRLGSVEARLELDRIEGDHDATEHTAVHAHARAVRDQRRVQRDPAPGGVPMKLEPVQPMDDGEKTVLMPNVPSASPAAATPAPAPPPNAASKRGRAQVLLAIVGALVVLVLVLLWVRSRGH